MTFWFFIDSNFSVLKVKADMSMRKAGSTSETSQKEEEVVMNTNQAYETVIDISQPQEVNHQHCDM